MKHHRLVIVRCHSQTFFQTPTSTAAANQNNQLGLLMMSVCGIIVSGGSVGLGFFFLKWREDYSTLSYTATILSAISLVCACLGAIIALSGEIQQAQRRSIEIAFAISYMIYGAACMAFTGLVFLYTICKRGR